MAPRTVSTTKKRRRMRKLVIVDGAHASDRPRRHGGAADRVDHAAQFSR
jgi:hypothetical protein